MKTVEITTITANPVTARRLMLAVMISLLLAGCDSEKTRKQTEKIDGTRKKIEDAAQKTHQLAEQAEKGIADAVEQAKEVADDLNQQAEEAADAAIEFGEELKNDLQEEAAEVQESIRESRKSRR